MKLKSEVARIDMRVLYARYSNQMKLLPNTPKASEERFLAVEELGSYTPQSNKIMRKLSKRWIPLTKANAEETRQNKRKSMATMKRQKPARTIAEEFGMNAILGQRFERIAISNKKALRQLMKQAAAKWDPAEKAEKWNLPPLPTA